MTGGERRRHPRVPVAAKRVTVHLRDAGGREESVPAQLLDVSLGGMGGSGRLPSAVPGAEVAVELDVPWWRFAHRVTLPAVVRRLTPDGSRWALEFSLETGAARKRLEGFVRRAQEAFRRLAEGGSASRLAEAFRTIELSFGPCRDDRARIILISSAVAGEGKGPVAIGLAIVLAQKGVRVLLVNADPEGLSFPGEATSDRGLFDALRADGEEPAFADSTLPIGPNLDLLPAGRSGRSPVLLEQNLGPLVSTLRSSGYRFVVINAPPLLRSASGSLLAAVADDVFVVVRNEESKERELVEVRDLLARGKAPFRGIVLTDESEASGDEPGRRFGLGRLARRAAGSPPAETRYPGRARWGASGAGD